MKKQGFTLIELLAVIAIMAVLAIIAIPNVIKLFNTAKKNAFLTEAKNIEKAIQMSYQIHLMNATTVDEIQNNYEYGELKSSSGGILELDIPIKKFNTVDINISSIGEIRYALFDGTYCLEHYAENDEYFRKIENEEDERELSIVY